MSIRLSLITFISVLFFLAESSQAGLVTGLNPGDQYRIAFVTQGTRDATSSNIADYDAFVTSQANMAGSLTASLATSWRVIGSTATVDAKIHTATDDTPSGINGVPIFLVDGTTKIADDYDDLWDGTIDFPLSLDQFGMTSSSPFRFTGTDANGTAGVFAGQFPAGLGAATFSNIGSTNQTNAGWVATAVTSPGNTGSFLAISDPFTAFSATAVPEPSSFVSFGLVVMGFAGRRRRRSLRTQ